MNSLNYIIAILAWLAGIVIAKGFVSTFFAIIIPLYSWYLLVERILLVSGLI